MTADGILTLRPATDEDSARLLAWRNDPETRLQSKTAGVVPQADHVAWLSRVLASADVALCIAEIAGEPVGSVRADREKGRWTLSWTVAPTARGRNVGVRMVDAMIRELAAPVRAEIKPGNAASLRMAEKLGMARAADEDGMTVWTLDP
jgi:RimJ/RimL family protein N-acetyltransferase